MENQATFHKTRIAPTPSGYLHLGNIYSFMLTAALAQKYGARILLRIDDQDRERLEMKYVQDILDTLHFLDIHWDEGPRNIDEFEKKYSQLCRADLYSQALQQLRDDGHVYACTCSRSQIQRESPDMIYPGTCRHKNIPLDSPNVSWRLKTDTQTILHARTLNGPVIAATLPADMNDFVVRKKDSFPAYQLSSVIDDTYFGIDLVVRGEDLWHSTLAQLYLASLLKECSFSQTTFVHHRLLKKADGEKLSKSAGDTSIYYLRKEGKTAQDIYKMIADIDFLNDITGAW